MFFIQIKIKKKAILGVLSYLCQMGLLKNFFIFNSSRVLISFNFVFNSFFFSKIKPFPYKTNKVYISYKALKIINKSSFSTIIVLSTSYGLLTIKKALSMKIGGIALFKVI